MQMEKLIVKVTYVYGTQF